MHQIHYATIDRHVAQIVFVREHNPRLNVVLSLARVLIILAFVVAFVALAVVAARRVRAMLRAYAWRFETFIDVGARFSVRQQFVALIAVAVVTGECVNAFVATLMDLHFGAFVDVAMQRFIGFIAAIGHFVAHQLVVDALTVGACELTGCACCVLFLRAAHLV